MYALWEIAGLKWSYDDLMCLRFITLLPHPCNQTINCHLKHTKLRSSPRHIYYNTECEGHTNRAIELSSKEWVNRIGNKGRYRASKETKVSLERLIFYLLQ